MPDPSTDGRLITLILITIAAFVIFPMFVMGFGMWGFGPMMGGMWGGEMWGPGWMFAVVIVMQLLFLGVLVGGGYLVVKAFAGRERGPEMALDELRLAYARGELTDEEYEKRREALERDAESR